MNKAAMNILVCVLYMHHCPKWSNQYTPIIIWGYSCSASSPGASFYRWETETHREELKGLLSICRSWAWRCRAFRGSPVSTCFGNFWNSPTRYFIHLFNYSSKKIPKTTWGSGPMLGSEVKWLTREMWNLYSTCSNRKLTYQLKK